MQDKRPEDKPDSGANSNEPVSDSQNWRDQRRQWRQERREHRSRDPLRGLFVGLVLVMLGILFFINQQSGIGWEILWKYLLVGLGSIFIIDGLAHFWSPSYRDTSLGRFIPGIILLFVGLAFIYNFSQWWPMVLIAVGVVILVSLLFRRK
jgi:hypothetical protein